ncbi:hypothetical protein LEP1GSC151_3252 [Leptospira interrogans serovar Grippotyphosa str. LT2186]|uniref:Uncharacterized protein n=1 Tax=Leptospira interrogans serovar Grippotyphosa str. LT2186 TaxID=1001599 RepID=M3HES5_LEPIR|nr:hypothetical protein LEP1GSC151_3252 [Leptospira interrogans serovar Grippotyphosa str. LT2186]
MYFNAWIFPFFQDFFLNFLIEGIFGFVENLNSPTFVIGNKNAEFPFPRQESSVKRRNEATKTNLNFMFPST